MRCLKIEIDRHVYRGNVCRWDAYIWDVCRLDIYGQDVCGLNICWCLKQDICQNGIYRQYVNSSDIWT